jgi:hypothetical protein
MAPLDIGDVSVGGEIGRRIDITIANNVLVIDADRDFLEPFRRRNSQGGYIGLGKFIDSLVRFAAYSKDPKVLALKQHVVREAIATQEADGYIGVCRPEMRMWHLWDIHEMGYLVMGLTADHAYFDEEPSLDAARRLADYIITRWSDDPDRKTEGWISTYVATTGLVEAMLALSVRSGDERYLDFAVRHRKLAEWDTPLIQGRWGHLEGHAYYHMAHCLAQLRLNEIQPNARLLNQSRATLDFLVRKDGLLAPGLCGYHECWHSNQQGFYKLGETCATAYLIRWLDALLRHKGDSLYGDIVERAIYNGLFAAQSPNGRRLRYYAPFEGKREYFQGDTYCCPCNYRRIIAELPEMICYRREDGLAINLYARSAATTRLADNVTVDIRQETDYPNSGEVTIRLTPSKPVHFPLFLRVPRWCDEARITVNGDAVEMTAPGGCVLPPLFRTWRARRRGPAATLPMPWRAIRGRKSQEGRVAVMRGPLLFCLNPQKQDGLDPEAMKLLRLDVSSLRTGDADKTIRPDGLTCHASFWKPEDYNAAGPAELQFTLTEYADPEPEWTYFWSPTLTPTARSKTSWPTVKSRSNLLRNKDKHEDDVLRNRDPDIGCSCDAHVRRRRDGRLRARLGGRVQSRRSARSEPLGLRARFRAE